jgi:hypothetical protein
MSDCKNNDSVFVIIFAGSSTEKRGFLPTHTAFGGTSGRRPASAGCNFKAI